MKLMVVCIFCSFLFGYAGRGEEFRLHMKAAGNRTVRYFADHAIEQYDDKCEYCVVQVHGFNGGDSDGTKGFRRIIAERTGNDQVLFFAPCFPISKRMSEDEKRDFVYWEEGQWQPGYDSPVAPGLCAYDVLDAIFHELNSLKRYPKLKHVLFCGFSAGGQIVSRYVAVAKIKPRKGLKVDFAAGGPSTWLYLDDKRMDEHGKFKVPRDTNNRYNNWHLGLDRPTRYAASVSQSSAVKNLAQRGLLCFCGTEDVLEKYLNMKPGAMLQGKNRYERFKNYQKHIQRFPKLAKAVRFVEVPGAGHEGRCWDIPEVIDLAIGKVPTDDEARNPKDKMVNAKAGVGKK